MSHSLPSIFTKERLWAIRLWQKSDRSDLLFFTCDSLFRSQKTSELLIEFPTLAFCKKINNFIISIQYNFYTYHSSFKDNENMVWNIKNIKCNCPISVQISLNAIYIFHHNTVVVVFLILFTLRSPECWASCHSQINLSIQSCFRTVI